MNGPEEKAATPCFAPDPFLTAQIFTPSLDNAASMILLKIEEAITQSPWSQELCFWFLRRFRGGDNREHCLEVLVHGPYGITFNSRSRTQVREAVLESSRDYVVIDKIYDSRLKLANAPPNSIEGRASTSLFTPPHPRYYQRDPKLFAGNPFIIDDTYVSLFIECMSKSAAVIIKAMKQRNATLYDSRQTLFLRFLVAALSVCGLDSQGQRQFLKYQRDWILRFPFLIAKKAAQEFQNAAQLKIGIYERHIETNRAKLTACLEVIRPFLAKSGASITRLPGELLLWRNIFHRLLRRIEELAQLPDFYRDPYAAYPIFSMIFKICNMTANQLGLSRNEEAFVAHFLLRSFGSTTDEPRLEY